uniref:Uncharacterized protein n=1 Tax=Amphiprion percula TaxID=161767 RepID=A0A3P8SEK8_AMPPE
MNAVAEHWDKDNFSLFFFPVTISRLITHRPTNPSFFMHQQHTICSPPNSPIRRYCSSVPLEVCSTHLLNASESLGALLLRQFRCLLWQTDPVAYKNVGRCFLTSLSQGRFLPHFCPQFHVFISCSRHHLIPLHLITFDD